MTDTEPILPEDRHIWHLDRLLSLTRQPDRAALLRELAEAAKALTGSCEARVVVAEASTNPDDPSYYEGRPASRPHAGTTGESQPALQTPTQTVPPERQDGFLSLPIMLEGEELGSLVVWDRGEGGKYSAEEQKRAELLAAQAGVALGFIRLKEEREKWLERMVQLDSQKSSFIAIASHELRTPLGLILGYSTYLREVLKKAEEGQAPSAPTWHEELDTIVSSAMRLKEIVDSLAGSDNVERGLALVRGGEFSLREVVKEALEGIREEAGKKKIHLKSDFGKGSLTVEGDRGKVVAALGNLVHNAVTYTEKGGHVTVSASEEKGRAVTVEVIDDGIGVPAKDLEHIFERFYQVEGHMNRKHGGLGLGLSLARENVELHGGRIWAESEEGKGSRFCFELPVRRGTLTGALRSGDAPPPEEDLRKKARKLLEM